MNEITLDLVARYPRPGLSVPGNMQFSPDGKMLTFLHAKDESLTRVLWSYDVATGERAVLFDPVVGMTDENVSREEALRRERQRLLHTGVTHYEWAEDADVILVPVRGELWVLQGGSARSVGENAVDPHLSPDGTNVAFVRDGDLYVVEVPTREERRLTHDAEPGVTNGVAEFVAQEEMARARGFWWSPDSASIAFEHADERQIPEYHIPHWTDESHDVEVHRYPFAGAANATVKLGVVSARGTQTRWLDLGSAEYLARVDWHPDGRLFVQTMNRDQTMLELRAFSSTGEATTLLTERSDVWVNLHNDLRFVTSTGEFVWSSERSGFNQLYLYSARGDLVRQITDDPWPVAGVVRLDDQSRRVAYLASPTPVETHVMTADLDAGKPKRITRAAGSHGAVFSNDLATWVELAHDRATPPSYVLHGTEDRVVHAPATVDLPLVTPELFTFTSRDGETLHGMVYKPASLPAPLIVHVYGGPHAQMVSDGWTAAVDMRAQYLVQQGFVVMAVDNRGSARRGLAFEGAILRRMGSIEVDDQVDGVRFAQQQGWVDGGRVGIYGWSYGGYMVLMSMLKASDVFRVGVAGAPVTAWDGYDTFYTERYMRTPKQNADGYAESSVLSHVANLEGKLLLVHGMIDENVHFRHSARFMEALAKANKSCDLLLYPNERHTPRSEADRRNMEERIVTYFTEHL